MDPDLGASAPQLGDDGEARVPASETTYDAARRPAHHSTAVSSVTKSVGRDHLPRPALVGVAAAAAGVVGVVGDEAERLVQAELGGCDDGQQRPRRDAAGEEQQAAGQHDGGDECQSRGRSGPSRRPRCAPRGRR